MVWLLFEHDASVRLTGVIDTIQAAKEGKFMKKIVFACCFSAAILAIPCVSGASTVIGGDATDQASANDILDIMFLIDTSGSMTDDIKAIGAVAESVVTNLQCPDCNVYVRARFMGIGGTYGSVFDESLASQSYKGSVDHLEDNGWAAAAAASALSGTWWVNDATADQDYYRAVVTIGDEGTDNGQPVDGADWTAAHAANQAAINNGVFLFSWVTDDPYAGVVNLFQTMSMGGTGGGYTFGFAGGGFVDDSAGTGDVAATLERIICTAGSGGGGPEVPEPATVLLFGTGLAGLAGAARRKKS